MTVAILGAGVMGETVLSGLLRAGRPPSELLMSDRRPSRAAELRERYGVDVVSNVEAAAKADTLMLVVKPQDMPDLLDEIAPVVKPGQLVVSLAAGITTASIESAAARGCPGRPRHAQHPGSRRRGDGGHLAWARTATRRTSPRPSSCCRPPAR